MPITARFTIMRYTLEDDGDGGLMPVYDPADEHGAPEFYSDDLEEFDTVPELADAIRDHACTACSSSHPGPGDWFCSPDGSYTVDYRAGTEEEPAVFLVSDLKPRQFARLVALVTA